MKKFYPLFTLLLLPFIFNCSDNGKNGIDDERFIIPLAVGNYWSYVKYDYLADDQSTYREEVTGKQTINGEEVFVLNGEIYVQNRKGGLYQYGFSWSTLDAPSMLYKYPAKKGEKWDMDVEMFNCTVKVEEKPVKIEVPAGIFECYHYRTLYPNFPDCRRESYVAPGIGNVLIEWYNKNAVYYKLELMLYHIIEE